MKLKRLMLIITILLTCSCSSTIVYVEKNVYIMDGKNWVEIAGSELKDNTASQSADGKLDIPLLK